MSQPETLEELIELFDFDVSAFEQLESEISEAFPNLEPHESRAAVYSGIKAVSEIMAREEMTLPEVLAHIIKVFAQYPELLSDAENTF